MLVQQFFEKNISEKAFSRTLSFFLSFLRLNLIFLKIFHNYVACYWDGRTKAELEAVSQIMRRGQQENVSPRPKNFNTKKLDKFTNHIKILKFKARKIWKISEVLTFKSFCLKASSLQRLKTPTKTPTIRKVQCPSEAHKAWKVPAKYLRTFKVFLRKAFADMLNLKLRKETPKYEKFKHQVQAHEAQAFV